MAPTIKVNRANGKDGYAKSLSFVALLLKMVKTQKMPDLKFIPRSYKDRQRSKSFV